MGTEQLKELKRLQKENERLCRAVPDLTLDKLILTEAASKSSRSAFAKFGRTTAMSPKPNSTGMSKISGSGMLTSNAARLS
jgi:hypothetical protein